MKYFIKMEGQKKAVKEKGNINITMNVSNNSSQLIYF